MEYISSYGPRICKKTTRGSTKRKYQEEVPRGSTTSCGDHWQYKSSCPNLPGSKVNDMSILKRLVQVAAVVLQCFCCRVPQRRAHQETERPHNDYRLLLQGSVVIAYPETKVQKVKYEDFQLCRCD